MLCATQVYCIMQYLKVEGGLLANKILHITIPTIRIQPYKNKCTPMLVQNGMSLMLLAQFFLMAKSMRSFS